MKKLIALALLLTACSSQQKATTSGPLDGLWQQISIGCDNDPENAFFSNERRAIAEGKSRNTLEIHNGKVESRYWSHRFGDPTEKGHCTLVVGQEWEITDSTYRVVKLSEPKYEDTEGEVCPTLRKNPPLTGNVRPYELKGDQLKISSPGSPKKPPKNALKNRVLVCPDANLMVTYKRVR